jgi:cytochrome c-type biogenesis protein CcmE
LLNSAPTEKLTAAISAINETLVPSFMYPPENIDTRKNKNRQVRRTGGWVNPSSGRRDLEASREDSRKQDRDDPCRREVNGQTDNMPHE